MMRRTDLTAVSQMGHWYVWTSMSAGWEHLAIQSPRPVLTLMGEQDFVCSYDNIDVYNKHECIHSTLLWHYSLSVELAQRCSKT